MLIMIIEVFMSFKLLLSDHYFDIPLYEMNIGLLHGLSASLRLIIMDCRSTGFSTPS